MAVRTASRFDRIVQTGLIAAFMALIALPFLGVALRLDERGLEEKRILAPPPALDLRHFSATHFTGQLQAYLTDHFGFRSTLVRWNARITAQTLAVPLSPRVMFGKDGWLFLADEDIIKDYRCLQPFTETELRQWAGLLERRRDWLKQRGCHYLFFVAPNQHTIYSEELPAYITRVRDTSRLDQLLAYLKAHSTVTVVDVRPALLAAKGRERVYQKTDTHWNERGAFAAYQEILKLIQGWFPGLQAVPRNRFQDTAMTGPGGDLAAMMGLTDLYPEEVLGLRPLDPRRAEMTNWPLDRLKALKDHPSTVEESGIPGSHLPRLVMFHDSFGTALKPFLAEHFARALFEFQAMAFDESILEREKPDLVIQEITERYMWVDFTDPNRQLTPE
jgi:hypothetical protein